LIVASILAVIAIPLKAGEAISLNVRHCDPEKSGEAILLNVRHCERSEAISI